MASLKQMRGKYYSRIRQWNGVKQIERLIPLKTSNKTDARLRHFEVEKYENDIKDGMEYRFAWLSNNCRTKVVQYTISDAIEKYHQYRKTNVRPSTVVRDGVAFKSFTKVIGSSKPIKKIDSSHIELYKKHQVDCGLKPVGININLRHIKTFLNWCYDEGLIDKQIKIKQLDVGKPLPRYLTESQLNQIMEIDWLENTYKDIFHFYVTTGCRVSEPFLGELINDWLIVDEQHSKNKAVRHIQLNDEQKDILLVMQNLQQMSLSKGCRPERITEKISVMFKRAIRYINLDDNITLHSLRHTYAVKRYLLTNDILIVLNFIDD